MLVLVVDEEGLIKGLPRNDVASALAFQDIYGPVLMVDQIEVL